MTEQEIIEMVREAGGYSPEKYPDEWRLDVDDLSRFAKLVAAKEREALEVELLKLKQGVASKSDYIQGRWDLIGEFQDIIRARGQK